MPSVTALELVNRVRTRLRYGTVSALSADDKHSQAILNLINGAVTDILTSKDWKFDRRNDGIFQLYAPMTSDTWTTVLGSPFITTTDVVIRFGVQNFYGDRISRIQITEDTQYGDVSFRIDRLYDDGVRVRTAIDVAWPGTAFAGDATGKIFISEYLFPDTVREVIAVRNEGTPLTLEQIDPGLTFDEYIPRRTDMFAYPEIAAVGGYDYGTYLTTGSQDVPKLRMILWPIPSEAAILQYSYYINHPRLADGTDELEGVPNQIVEDVVRLAHADSLATIERDVQDGLAAGRNAMMRNEEKYASHDPQPARRKPMNSWNGRRTAISRNVKHGFPGVTIPE